MKIKKISQPCLSCKKEFEQIVLDIDNDLKYFCSKNCEQEHQERTFPK